MAVLLSDASVVSRGAATGEGGSRVAGSVGYLKAEVLWVEKTGNIQSGFLTTSDAYKYTFP